MAKVIKRNGRYVLDFYDQYKKRKRVTLQLGTTLKQAKDKLREVEEKLARGMYIPEKKNTVVQRCGKGLAGAEKNECQAQYCKNVSVTY